MGDQNFETSRQRNSPQGDLITSGSSSQARGKTSNERATGSLRTRRGEKENAVIELENTSGTASVSCD
ncbi:predicted protein [Botrytis cinerea T4]|uniref:Uncharacterized protein n=1 Tax=Botryotinia fuckeliana (strain T4) TaxID=999810 RepID=G2XZ42_BOTF4|nr:predicted protein [Botrytis cinerea T4]